MGWSSRTCVTVLLAVLLAALTQLPPPATASEAPADPVVRHRVVWAEGARSNPGIHIRSAEADGTDVRPIYDWPHGFTLELTLDRAGRRVAFAPCCRPALPRLLVVPVLGGKSREPLRKHPSIDAVGGIGWSPNGRRIAFEGYSGPASDRVTTIWTVRPDGTGLNKVLSIPVDESGFLVANDALAWTPDGILYSDGEDLRSAWRGRSTLMMRNVRSARISGDGGRLVLERAKGATVSVWVSAADGSRRRKLFTQADPGEAPTYHDVTPSSDGSMLLALRLGSSGTQGSDVVTWPTDASPASADVLGFLGGPVLTATWN